MPLLEAQICDVWGAPLAGGTIYETTDGGGLEVIDPLNDSRTALVTIPIYDRPAKLARPLDRVLAIEYGSHLLFKGPILQVSTDYERGTVTISAHDPTIKLKHHYHRFGDLAVDGGYTIDGPGMRVLVESSLSAESETSSGIPPNGILWGHDSTTHRPDTKRKVGNGANVWETIINLSRTLIGPDFRFRPVDNNHVGVYPATLFPLGFMCEMDTADQLGEDKSGEVIYEHGLGADNAENVIDEPDGDVVRNQFSQVYPGGVRNRNDADRIATARGNGSIHDYGLMEGYESSGQKDSHDVLREKARAIITAYARPPKFFTVVPRIDDGDTVPRYPRDVRTGDMIRVRARKGEREFDEVGRIMRVAINSVDQAGNARISLECAPLIDDSITDVN
jgi:hypothetical protein